jgi:hypothetical protein
MLYSACEAGPRAAGRGPGGAAAHGLACAACQVEAAGRSTRMRTYSGQWTVDYTERPCAPLAVRPRGAPLILCSWGNLQCQCEALRYEAVALRLMRTWCVTMVTLKGSGTSGKSTSALAQSAAAAQALNSGRSSLASSDVRLTGPGRGGTGCTRRGWKGMGSKAGVESVGRERHSRRGGRWRRAAFRKRRRRDGGCSPQPAQPPEGPAKKRKDTFVAPHAV